MSLSGVEVLGLEEDGIETFRMVIFMCKWTLRTVDGGDRGAGGKGLWASVILVNYNYN